MTGAASSIGTRRVGETRQLSGWAELPGITLHAECVGQGRGVVPPLTATLATFEDTTAR